MKEFTQLKRTYPTSLYKRECDGYTFIMKNSTKKERIEWDIQEIIEIDEKYIYEVGKVDDKFVTKSTSFKNNKIIRNHILGLRDD